MDRLGRILYPSDSIRGKPAHTVAALSWEKYVLHSCLQYNIELGGDTIINENDGFLFVLAEIVVYGNTRNSLSKRKSRQNTIPGVRDIL